MLRTLDCWVSSIRIIFLTHESSVKSYFQLCIIIIHTILKKQAGPVPGVGMEGREVGKLESGPGL